MGHLVMFIGGIAVLFGAFDVMTFGDSEDDRDWKKPIIKIAGGLAIAGVGALMKYFGI
ncbi:MAG: hypothetical protein HYT22_01290 [Candidatus Niyogibacteria bacterium]|nr:hypothetical protein [Candidatus Niyogibacteria bacterium]